MTTSKSAHVPNCGQSTAQLERAFRNKTGQVKKAITFDLAVKKSERGKRRGRKDAAFMRDQGKQNVDKEDVEKVEDAEYVPKVDFTPNMRFTDIPGGNPRCRALSAVSGLFQSTFEMKSAVRTITAAAGRGDTGVTMARAPPVSPLKAISADRWANRGEQFAEPGPALHKKTRNAALNGAT